MTLLGGAGLGLPMYHVGLVVPDVRAAMEQYSDTLGLTWASLRETKLKVVVDGQRRVGELAVTYSLEGPPHLELIQERGGSVWGADGLNLTHIGFWAADLEAAKRRLEESGLASAAYEHDGEGRLGRFSFHASGGGVWLELVRTTFQDDLDRWFAATRAT
jgi:methylmalonyl-CoA/ethylmalonyl-CoA epimerase